jgi:hypothetical protein
MSSTILTPTPTTDVPIQAPTTTPSPQPPSSPLDFSGIEGHAEHAWDDVKNLFTTGDTTGHPEQTEKNAEQEVKNQATQNQGEADYKNFLYKSSPDEFKQAYPAEYLYRKAYNTTKDAITEPAEHMLTGKAREEIAPKIDKLAETGLGLVGAVKPGEPKPVIDTGNISGPEGELEESAAKPINFDSIPGHKTVEAPTSPHPRLPDSEYVYHATDKSRADAIRQSGLRPKSWYAPSPEEALKSGAVPISGNRADLRVFAVPRSEIEAVAPDAADMGAREVEKGRFVMSGKGHQPIEVDHNGAPFQPVETKPSVKGMQGPPVEKAGIVQNARKILRDPTATEEDRAIATRQLEHHQETQFDEATPNIKPTAVVDPKIQKTVEDAGGVYRGQNKDGIVEITLPEHMTKDLPISEPLKKYVSVNLHANEVTPEAVKGAIDRKLTEFGGKTMARKALAKD